MVSIVAKNGRDCCKSLHNKQILNNNDAIACLQSQLTETLTFIALMLISFTTKTFAGFSFKSKHVSRLCTFVLSTITLVKYLIKLLFMFTNSCFSLLEVALYSWNIKYLRFKRLARSSQNVPWVTGRLTLTRVTRRFKRCNSFL